MRTAYSPQMGSVLGTGTNIILSNAPHVQLLLTSRIPQSYSAFAGSYPSFIAFEQATIPSERSVGPVPGDGSLYCVAVRGGLQVAEGGFELAGVDDEGRAELVGGLAHLAQQRRGDTRDREQRGGGDARPDRDRLPGCLSDH